MLDVEAPDITAPRRFAKSIIGARADFERIYDEQAAQHSQQECLPFKVLTLGTRNDKEAYQVAFEEAENLGWLRRLVMAVHAAGLFTQPTIANEPDAEEVQEIVAQVQAMINPDAGMLRPELLPQGVARSMRQVCRILVDDGVTAHGTGFLVGPQMIITCFHVVDTLINSGEAIVGSDARLVIEFDDFGLGAKSRYRVPRNWLVASRPCSTREKPKANGENRFGILSKEDLAEPDSLDFALIRVAGTPGRERGYQCLDRGRWPGIGKYLWVFQYPFQFSQRLSPTTKTAWHDQETRLRLVHSANTASGSSGGMCTNASFEAVALHQCAMYSPQNQPLGNGAVPIAHIALLPEAGLALAVDPQLDPLWLLPASGEPVFGREDFQALAWQLVDGKRRLLVVRGGPECGKSFTGSILKAMLPSAEHTVIDISAANLPPLPRSLATAILARIEAKAGEILPDSADAATTDAAWIKDELFPAFRKRLGAAAGSRMVWIVIDDLNHHTVPDTGGRAMLELLYQQLPEISWLRIVLIGLTGPVPAADWRQVYDYSVPEVQAAHVEAWLLRYAMEKGIPLDLNEARRHGKVAVQLAKRENNWLAALPRIVLQTVVPVLDEDAKQPGPGG